MNNDGTQRISPQSEPGENGINSLLAEASAVAQGVLESIQALAGTTACKGVQIARLKDWAINRQCWIDNIDSIGIYSDRGSENEVYASSDNTTVYKLNDFRYADDNLIPFFIRIQAHNHFFPDCSYAFLGMAENRDGKVCAVLRQSFIQAEREATQKEIDEELERIGFHKEMDGGYFTNGEYDIFDAVPNNVLMGCDGHLYFIDTIIFESGSQGYEIYSSLSPRAQSH